MCTLPSSAFASGFLFFFCILLVVNANRNTCSFSSFLKNVVYCFASFFLFTYSEF